VIGWWYTYPSEKYEFVSWDDSSQYMESHKIHVPNHKPDMEKYNFFKARSSSHHIWGVPPELSFAAALAAEAAAQKVPGNTNSRGSLVRPLGIKKKHIKTTSSEDISSRAMRSWFFCCFQLPLETLLSA